MKKNQPNTKSRRHLVLLAAASGLLSAGPFFPFGLSWLILVSLGPLLAATCEAGPRRGALYGFVAGFVGCGIAFYWIVPLISKFTALPWPLALLGFLLWLLLASCFWAVLGMVWGVAYQPGVRLAVCVAFPVVLERVWPRIFCWHFGDPLVEISVLAQIADLGGVAGVSLVVLVTNYAVWRVGRAWWRGETFPCRAVALAGALLCFSFGYGLLKLHRPAPAAAHLRVGLVHAAVPLQEKHDAMAEWVEGNEILQGKIVTRLLTVAREGIRASGPVDLVVMPEAVVNRLLDQRTTVFAGWLKAPVLYGAGVWNVKPPMHYNSAILEEGRTVQQYHKHHLMIFGEYIPLANVIPGLEEFIGLYSLDRGTGPTPLSLGDHRLASLVCYEAIIPGYVRQFVKAGGELLVNVTEDGWYQWPEQYQHFLLSRLRAVENRRYLVRCVNNGITAIIDPAGRIVARSGDGARAEFLRSAVGLYSDPSQTLYTRWGDWLVFLLAAILVCLGGRSIVVRLRDRARRD